MSEPDIGVIVVGGGVAGLVAARRLALAGCRVIVLESEPQVGGQVWRHTLDGAELDAAADSFATRDGSVVALMAELGIGHDLVLPRPTPAWVHRADGTSAPLPATGVLGIPGDPLAKDVVAAIGWRAALRARADAVLPARIGADADSLGELVRRRMGRGVLEGLVAPVVRGVHSREPDQLPLETASPRLRSLLREKRSLAAAVRAVRAASPAGSQVAGIRGGIFRLVDALETDCVRLGVTIERGVRVDRLAADRVTAGARTLHGRVVLATADPTLPPPNRRRLTLTTLVVVAPDLDAAPRGTGVLVSAGAAEVTARALTHLSAKWEWVASAVPGRHVIRLSYDGEPADPIATARRDGELLLGVPLGTVIDSDALPVHRPVPAPSIPRTDGIPVIGESVSGTGLASVVTQAERVARALVAARDAPDDHHHAGSRTAPPRDRMEQ